MLTCPYCGEDAMGHVGKALLGPARSVKCRRCGKRVSVGWITMAFIFPVMVVAVGLFALTHSYVVLIAAAALGQVLSLVLHSLWVPIVARDGPPANRCRGCGYDVAGLAKEAVCPECGKTPTG